MLSLAPFDFSTELASGAEVAMSYSADKGNVQRTARLNSKKEINVHVSVLVHSYPWIKCIFTEQHSFDFPFVYIQLS